MSVIGNPIDTSILQGAQAQQSAAKARDRDKAAASRRPLDDDRVELRVDEVESVNAVRKLPQSDSEAAAEEERRRPDDEGHHHVDVQA